MKGKPQSLGVLVLAAGKGTRMHSGKPKVLQPLLDEPVLYYPLAAIKEAGFENVAVLVGHQGEMVESYIEREWSGIEVVWQREQLGTGHAVTVAQSWWEKYDNLLVLSGDVPLIRSETIKNLVDRHIVSPRECTFLSFITNDPASYGRIVRLADGGVRIVEAKDAEAEELAITEINAGIYIFRSDALARVLPSLGRNNTQNEFYLTDAIPLIGEQVGSTDAIPCDDMHELMGINNAAELSDATRTMRDRIVFKHMAKGLKCIDYNHVWIGPRVEVGIDVWLEPGAEVWGRSVLSDGSRVGSNSALRNVTLGENSVVKGPSVLSDAKIGAGVEVGPFAFMRDGAEIRDNGRVGRFVEIKKSLIMEGAKVPHLSYIGDAEIGKKTNIGAGTITCNYDGVKKNKTKIGDRCFVGSDTMFVAPVEIGDEATTAAGSVITKPIPNGALGIARERQTNVERWNERKRVTSAEGKAE